MRDDGGMISPSTRFLLRKVSQDGTALLAGHFTRTLGLRSRAD